MVFSPQPMVFWACISISHKCIKKVLRNFPWELVAEWSCALHKQLLVTDNVHCICKFGVYTRKDSNTLMHHLIRKYPLCVFIQCPQPDSLQR